MFVSDLIGPFKKKKKKEKRSLRGAPFFYYGLPFAVVQGGPGEDTVGAGAGVDGGMDGGIGESITPKQKLAQRVANSFKPPKHFRIDAHTWAFFRGVEEYESSHHVIYTFEIDTLADEDEGKGSIRITFPSEYYCSTAISLGSGFVSFSESFSHPVTWEKLYPLIEARISVMLALREDTQD